MKKWNPPRFKKVRLQKHQAGSKNHNVWSEAKYLPEEAGHSYENEVGQEEEQNSRVDIAEAHITNA